MKKTPPMPSEKTKTRIKKTRFQLYAPDFTHLYLLRSARLTISKSLPESSLCIKESMC